MTLDIRLTSMNMRTTDHLQGTTDELVKDR